MGCFHLPMQQFQSRLLSHSVPVHRIERILANRGLGTRKDILSCIQKGKVVVKGKVIRSGADRFPANVTVTIDGQISKAAPLIALYNKPVGVHSVIGDPWNRPDLKKLHEIYDYTNHMHPVGRLDADTSGLLLFSSDGALTTQLLNPLSSVEREYEAIVTGYVTHDSLQSTLANGVKTSDGVFKGVLLESTALDTVEDSRYIQSLLKEYSSINTIADVYREQKKRFLPTTNTAGTTTNDIAGGSEVDYHLPYSYVRLTVTEGKYRMVRRILHNAGHTVCFLHRRRYGPVSLQPATSIPSTNVALRSAQLWPPKYTEALNTMREGSDEEISWMYAFMDKVKK